MIFLLKIHKLYRDLDGNLQFNKMQMATVFTLMPQMFLKQHERKTNCLHFLQKIQNLKQNFQHIFLSTLLETFRVPRELL